MKAVIQRALRQFDLELKSRKGPMRVATMSTGLDWLSRQEDLVVASVLDVGASDGRWSRECMARYPTANYVLFEPNPVHRAALDAFEQRYPRRVSIVSAAVGSAAGSANFRADDAFSGALVEGEDVPGERSFVVPVTTLDDAVAERFQGPYLLKLDTHGFERGILEGARAVLEDASILIIEAYAHRLTSEGLTFWDLCAFLEERGFRPIDLVDVMHRERDGSLWQMDIVFARASWPGFGHASYT